ncbi:DUF167 domain-containing protein [Sediminicoccus rosea]|uniref:UPF0235 protein R9Z33_22120 n=1 Tax=Sediminicoccus rosea TaxID=1225128 RepID=A0ABZ0PHB8_9PROT|nr:DUF167 family protein [Sediminicoccus rosea]WPB84777.1 DUF167 family protein [Sediminicoccus rosea]
MAEPFQVTPEGLRLVVRLTPRAGRDGLDGVATTPDAGTHLRLRLSAPPVEGAANAALIAFLARALGLRKSDIRLLAGERARVKRLLLAGDGAELARRVTAWITPST